MNMSINGEIQKEYEKVKNEKIIGDVTIDNLKNNFAEQLLNSQIGEELKKCDKFYTIPQKKKIPFKIRFKNFINKLKFVLNGTE